MTQNQNHKNEAIEVAIIGAGFGGIASAVRLKQAGKSNFKIFEQQSELGGTWRDNTYPGCSCDVPAPVYEYSFYSNPKWSQLFAGHSEILSYLKNCVSHFDLLKHIQFNTEITEIRFLKEPGIWEIRDDKKQVYYARYVIAALGPLNIPNFPNIKGRETYAGISFHSNRWNHDFDLKDKSVAVIGTGASAIQFVPEIAKEVKELFIFQRTPPWIAARPNIKMPGFVKTLFSKLPKVQQLFRGIIYRIMEFRGQGLTGNKRLNRIMEKNSRRYIRRAIKDPTLRRAVTPNYKVGCKRMLFSSDFYPALNQENVQLVTDAIKEINQKGVLVDQQKDFEVDAIIYGTGFIAADYTKRFEAIGQNGESLKARWIEHGPTAYKGTVTHGFPNLFFIMGPNTGLGHNSVVHIMESQNNFIMDYIDKLSDLPGQAYFDVLPEIEEQYNKDLQEGLENMVWNSGCNSWYISSKGKNTNIYPGLSDQFRAMTKEVDLEHLELFNESSKTVA